MIFAFTAPEWLSTWLTPVWLLGIGALLGLLILGALWLPLLLLPMGRRVPAIVREGPLFPIFIITALLAAFGILGTLFVVRNPDAMFASLAHLPASGEYAYQFQIDAGPPNVDELDVSEFEPQAVPISLNPKEIVALRFRSPDNVEVSAFPKLLTETQPSFEVFGGEPAQWERQEEKGSPFPEEHLDSFYVWNKSTKPTTLQMTAVIAPVHYQVRTIPATALVVVVIFLAYFLMQAKLPDFIMDALPPRVQSALQPKISAIALATAKSEMAQPLFLICMVLGCFFLTLFVVLPYNTFGEDIKMMKDSGLTLIMVLSIIVCLWAASNSISEEIEGRTALTVLSKPVSRWQFILGKFAGISWVAVVMFLLLGLWFLIAVAYKPLYDARETANTDPNWQQCHLEMVQSAPGLALGFFETLVLAAISVAISTRLPMLANFIICVSIYALGHLTPMIVKSSIGSLELVVFVARLFATVLPVLEHFDIKPAIAGGVDVPFEYLGWSLLYCILYSTVAMLLAMTLFEDRDLA